MFKVSNKTKVVPTLLQFNMIQDDLALPLRTINKKKQKRERKVSKEEVKLSLAAGGVTSLQKTTEELTD